MEVNRQWLVIYTLAVFALLLVQAWDSYQPNKHSIATSINISDYTIDINGADVALKTSLPNKKLCALNLSSFANAHIDRLTNRYVGENTRRLTVEDLLHKFRVEFSLLAEWIKDYRLEYLDLNAESTKEYQKAFDECDIGSIDRLVLRDFQENDPKINWINSVVRSVEGQLYLAKELLSKGKNVGNSSPLIIAQRGHIAFYLKQYAEAANHYQKAVKHKGFINDNPEQYILMLQNLGSVYLGKQEPLTAIPFFEKALEILVTQNQPIPSLTNRNYLYLALALQISGSSEEALTTINEFEKNGFLSAANEPLYFLKSDIFYRLGDLINAKQVLDHMIDNLKGHVNTEYKQLALKLRKAEVDIERKDWSSAAQALKTFDERDLKSLEGVEVSHLMFWKLYSGAYIYSKTRQPDKAEKLLADAFSLEGITTSLINQRVIQARYLYSVVLDRLGKQELAEEQFNLAMNDIDFYYGSNSMESISGKKNYALYLFKQNKVSDAALYLRKALVLSTRLLGSTHKRTQEIRSNLQQLSSP